MSEPMPSPPEISPDTLHHILRIHLPRETMDRHADDVINYCRRTGCQEVLLFTTSYDKAPSFASLEEIEKYVVRLEPSVQRLREAKIVVSLNVLQTVGHIYFPQALQEEFPFRRRVYADGKASPEGACPLCPNLQKWAVSSYRKYARLKPRVLFVDDDFRAFVQGLSCFCEEHLRLMSRNLDRNVTREEVVDAIYSQDSLDCDLRKAYWEATTAGFSELAAKLREAVHSVSPDTRMGGMSAAWPTGTYGQDWGVILNSLAGTYRPLLRPQAPMYSEGFLRDMPGAFSNPGCLRAALPGNVEYWPEIENYQYGPHAKSAQCTFVQIAATVLQGFDHVALNVFDMYGTPFSDDERLVALLEKRRPFLNALHTLVPEGNRPQGVRVVVHPQKNTYPHFSRETENAFPDKLPNLGVPICHEGDSPWTMLIGRDVGELSDTEIDSTLKRGALLDAEAVSILSQRGFSARIGATASSPLGDDNLGYEEFISPETNPTFQGRCFPMRPLITSGDWKKLEDLTGGGIEASVIRNYRQEKVGPGLLLTENPDGERFGILAWSGKGSRYLIENRMRAEQIRRTFGWIARKPLPCATSEGAPYLWIICNLTAEGNPVIGVVNLSTDTYDEIPIIIGSEHVSRRIRQLDLLGELSETKVSHRLLSDEETIINIPTRLAPLDMAVFVMD